MKTRTSSHLCTWAGAAALAFLPSIRAATITSGGVTTVASGGVAPGTSTNYDFFGGGAQPSHLTTFTLTTPPPFQFDGVNAGGGAYSSVQAPGGSTVFTTGIGQPPGATNTPITADLATFTINAAAGTNRSFGAYVLFGITDGINVFDASIGLRINGGTVFTVPVTDTTFTNDFLLFNISGVNAGDTLTFSATDTAADAHGSTSNKPYIGGVTFSGIVPEPSTWALLGLGGACLLGCLRGLRRVRPF